MGPIVRRAPFRRQPASVKRGDALGPFEGRVVDTDTNKPIERALVWCSWAFSRGLGSPAPEAMRNVRVYTDPDGRYRIPRLKALPIGLSTQLSRFTLVVYRRGYVAYRHDRRFGAALARRSSFSQFANVVKLSRWSPELSHARHMLFLGGPPSMRADTTALLAAALELDRPTAPLGETTPTKPRARKKSLAERLLISDEVRQITGYTGTLRGAPLSNVGDTADTWHLRAVDKAERYDVAVRLWRLSGDALVKRYEKLLASLPGSKQKPLVGDRSFVIAQGQILGLGFLSQARSALVLITCGRGQCTKDTHLEKIAATIEKNLAKLPEDSLLGGD
ncbi:MAG: hypothetical protein CSA24_02345 [Deltaproteobacteria bacterium]|nr:MAG: hypothetical protein CSB49_01115 [Pseudomonadota bacterium]PIE65621.1 MAG: hypothetical protein CSA24_02345 [Deltaproteobacteria bacterium]